MGNLNSTAALEAGARLETMVAESFVILLPNRDNFDRAKDWLSRFETGLRAGDALHPAIPSNRIADAIYSLDKLMLAAEKAGLARKRRDPPSSYGERWHPFRVQTDAARA